MPKTDLDDAYIGTCENCDAEQVWVRKVKSMHSEFGGAGRGFFDICFDCVGPVRYWNGPRGNMETPLNWPKEKVLNYLAGDR